MFELFFGNYLVENTLITKKQLLEVLEIQKTSRVKLGLIAVSKNMLTPSQTYEINMLQATLDKRFGDIAIEKGFLSKTQVLSLARYQKNPYLLLVQTLSEKDMMSMEDIENALKKFKVEYNLSDEEIEAMQNDNVDTIISVFIDIDKPHVKDIIAITLRSIIRFINTSVYFSPPKFETEKRFKFLSAQCLKGDINVFIGFEGDNDLLAIANPYAKENFSEIDEDALDAICEFINCISGLFASSLSYKNHNLELLPPLCYTECSLVSETGFYVLPLTIDNKEVSLIIGIDSAIDIM